MIISRRPIAVSSLRTESRGGVHRVSADVDGIPLWFESSDIQLFAAAEAFGSALLLVSQHRRRRLVIESTVCRTWAENVARVVAIWAGWWGYKMLLPVAETRGGVQLQRSHASATALCFSGGVDSFFSLVTGPRPEFLVAVHGFDISLSDTVRMAGLERSVTRIANSVGATPIIIRTNLREHPAGGRPHLWERAHGGALAAIGHVLGPNIT
ncbi:MAG: hypothetical protein M3O61_09565 [Gemmatimonadota bacterium]|nr:hypothetical protein [Gemmatimonadota bacterium]